MTVFDVLDRMLPDGYAVAGHEGAFAALFVKGYSPYTGGGTDAYYPASHKVYLFEREIVSALTAAGFRADGDTSRLPLKALAEKAGISAYGYNRLTYTRKEGSRFVIGAVRILEEIPEKPLEAKEDMHCALCGKCIKACPTGALTGGGGFCREKCLRDYMDHPSYDERMMAAAGGRVLGCDICQRVCPMNKSVDCPPPQELSDTVALILKGGVRTLEPIIGANMARKTRLTVCALIAAGNTRRKDLSPEISALKQDKKTALFAERAERLLSGKD